MNLLLKSVVFVILLNGCVENEKKNINPKNENSEHVLDEDVMEPTDHITSENTSEENEDDFSMDIPEEFHEYSLEEKQQKYPGNNRPEVVYGVEDGSVTIGMSMDVAKVSVDELEPFVISTKKGLLENLDVEWISSEFENINGNKFAILRFWSGSNEGKVYNLLCATSFNDKLVIVTYNCMESEYNSWKEEFEDLKRTIVFNPDEEKL